MDGSTHRLTGSPRKWLHFQSKLSLTHHWDTLTGFCCSKKDHTDLRTALGLPTLQNLELNQRLPLAKGHGLKCFITQQNRHSDIRPHAPAAHGPGKPSEDTAQPGQLSLTPPPKKGLGGPNEQSTTALKAITIVMNNHII